MSGNTNSGRKTKAKKEEKRDIKVIPPKHLKGDALKYWHRVIPILIERNTFDESDFFAFERLCIFYAEWKKLESIIIKNGMTYEGTTDRGAYLVRERPEAKLMLNMNKEIKDFERKFGLTPLDRKGSGLKSGAPTSLSIRDKY